LSATVRECLPTGYPLAQAIDHIEGRLAIVNLSGRWLKSDRKAGRADEGMDFRCQAAP